MRLTSVVVSLLLMGAMAACGRSGLGLAGDAASGGKGGGGANDGSAGPHVTTPQPPVGGQCAAGLSACGKGEGLRCYDLGWTNDHCGACGQACAPGIACQNGACQQYRCKGGLRFKALATADGDARILADFDGDGLLDMIGASGAGAMTLRYGAGDATFAAEQVIEGPVALWTVRAADLDQDGVLDLASVSGLLNFSTINAEASTVTIRRGAGNRAAPFADPTEYRASGAMSGLYLADFDGDGRPDLVAGVSTGIDYWRGQDGASFAYQTMLASPDMYSTNPGIPMAMDWNGDGILDLLYADGDYGLAGYGFSAIGGIAHLHYRLGQGDGSFGAEVACAILAGAIGDLDHDGRPDLISGSGLQGASLLLGIDGCHANQVVTLSGWPKYGGITMADLNGDGNLDVVADNDKNITVWVGDGQGGFAQSLSLSAYQTDQWPMGILLTGDVNLDGKLDLVWARDGKWGVFLNTCQ
jgi:hypothetical protein